MATTLSERKSSSGNDIGDSGGNGGLGDGDDSGYVMIRNRSFPIELTVNSTVPLLDSRIDREISDKSSMSNGRQQSDENKRKQSDDDVDKSAGENVDNQNDNNNNNNQSNKKTRKPSESMGGSGGGGSSGDMSAKRNRSSSSAIDDHSSAGIVALWNPMRWLSGGAKPESMEEVEARMFKCVRTPHRRYYVPIRNASLKIWTVSTIVSSPLSQLPPRPPLPQQQQQQQQQPQTSTTSALSVLKTTDITIPVVLVHGFCGGIALWIHNIDELSENGQRPFHAFDLLGFGRSSRPLFSADPIVAETQFIESIEDWRREMRIDRMILLGHSFGGYLSVAYALKYPKRVKALVLADPWGFPEKPSASKPDAPMPLWIRMIAKISQFVSPFALVRLSGQFGVKIFKNLRPDFRAKFQSLLDDPDLVYSYIYHANSLPPSGEYGFRTVAEYFGFAKNPMIRRIASVDNDIPMWFVYGGRSWIDHTAGFTSIHLRQNAISTTVKIITGAGHHVYADKPREFNEYVRYVYRLLDEFDQAPNEFFLDNDSIRSNLLNPNSIPPHVLNHHRH